MHALGVVFTSIGFLITLVFGIQILLLAFQESILWGLGYVLVPFVALIFVVMHWQETKTPFLRSLLSIPFYIVGFLLMGRS